MTRISTKPTQAHLSREHTILSIWSIGAISVKNNIKTDTIMEKLEKLTVSELIALYNNCAKKDEPKIEAEIERKTGINISEEQGNFDKVMANIGIIGASVFIGTLFWAAIKIILHF